ncbi:MAG: hypothetical protein AAF151_21695 [Cyanobacteria bacterium J06656_5]
MNPILKDWLQNLGCLLPLGFFGFCMALIGHWVSTETGPARALITWQAQFWNGQHFPRLTTAIFLVPTCLGAWLLFLACRRVLARAGVYDRPSTNVGFQKHPSERA